MIPEDWEVAALRRVATFKTDPSEPQLHRSDNENGIPWTIRVTNWTENLSNRDQCQSPKNCAELTDFCLKAGDHYGGNGQTWDCRARKPDQWVVANWVHDDYALIDQWMRALPTPFSSLSK